MFKKIVLITALFADIDLHSVENNLNKPKKDLTSTLSISATHRRLIKKTAKRVISVCPKIVMYYYMLYGFLHMYAACGFYTDAATGTPLFYDTDITNFKFAPRFLVTVPANTSIVDIITKARRWHIKIAVKAFLKRFVIYIGSQYLDRYLFNGKTLDQDLNETTIIKNEGISC